MDLKLANIDPIRREPLAIQVARRLVELILSGQVKPGDRMPSDRQLADDFGVGRSAVREALKSLSLIGLVEVRQGDGTYLRKANDALLPEVIEWGLLLGEQRTTDLVEARQHIEAIIAGLAAARRDERDIEDLHRLLIRMEFAADEGAFVEADVAFHLCVAEIARNTVLRDILSNVRALLRVWIRRVISSMGETRTSYVEHVPIVEAIERGDAAAASTAMEAHMASAAGRLREALAKTSPDERVQPAEPRSGDEHLPHAAGVATAHLPDR